MSLLNVIDMLEDNSSKVSTIYAMVERRVLVLLPSYGIDVDKVPKELEYIVDELAIQRYNLIGSEGMSKESSDGYSVDYRTDELGGYARDLEAYARKHGTANSDDSPSTPKGRWRFFL